jgi:DNA end-binding protein Ku
MYSAVQDRDVHFKMLSKKGEAPVHQRIIRKDTGEEVPSEARRKAFPLENGQAVILQPEELESLVPAPSRDIHLCHFVPKDLLTDQWFDRPYLLGPDGSEESYFALARAIGERGVHGIARWVMRKKRYLGALTATGDYLTMTTLRRSDQVLALPAVHAAPGRAPSEAELKLAEQLVDSISGDFAHELEDQEAEALQELAESKRKKHRDVIALADAEDEEPQEGGAQVADLVQLLRHSLGSSATAPAPKQAAAHAPAPAPSRAPARTHAPAPRPPRVSRPTASADLEARTREELYEMAAQREIAGRSKLIKAQLVKALRAGR